MSIFFSSFTKWNFAKCTNKSFNSLCYGVLSERLNNGRVRCYSTKSQKLVVQKGKFIPFLERINLRRAEAKRSIVVQVQSAQSFKELYTYCSSMGTVKCMFHYTTGVEPMHFIIIEFAEDSDLINVLSASSCSEENQAIPTQSQFLWFRAASRKLGKLKQNKAVSLSSENATNILNDDQIGDALRKCENVSEQMRELYSITRLNDVGTRLRFLTARQIENAISGMFPFARAYPFGSSVNGCGKMDCDLDLVLRLVDRKMDEDSRLIFHCKAPSGTERTMSQRHMESMGDLIHFFLPGCTNVRRILQARIPIIKYHQQLTDVECDLSMSNMSGVHMSDFLYLMGELDERVRPLIFTLRKWARDIGLTNSSPKPLRSPPVLPSLNTLVKLAGPDDKYVTEDGINCTFLRDMSKYDGKTANTESLESLLCEFFEFYSQFDFSKKAVCLNEAVALTKPEHSAMYIVNPLERGLNVSKNVSLEEAERFKTEVHNALWVLESRENKVENWGLLSIFERKQRLSYNINFPSSAKQGRLMEISTLFDEEKESSGDETENKVEFKSDSIKQEVDRIKKTTREKINAHEGGIKRQKNRR
ncbi:hypothetical protein NQ318_018798 [Aromia moschata]|uniref:Poly(A) RNA polymerase, mitochondrial n=1 Tax=Aromia moschata TaxID=1265417 RepID=A0AAV8ZIC1_9CUCU|nr:hypothetical protein NQ318_018798 [Aromia moschata]